MARTALIVCVLEAEAVVGEIRLVRDRSSSLGVPAHVTVLFPFADSDDIDEDALAELFATYPAFDFVLDRIERWDNGIVWLHPEPSALFQELTSAVCRRWPDYPPYGGTTDVVIPHVTVSETPIELELDLPIAAQVCEVTLIQEQTDGNWATRQVFRLGGPTHPAG